MKTEKTFILTSGKVLLLVAFVLVVSFVQPVRAAVQEDLKEQTLSSTENIPLYADPKYSSPAINSDANYEQKKSKSGGPPPPQEPEPNNTPVPSGIIPLLAMALGLTLWRIHKLIRKTRKTE